MKTMFFQGKAASAFSKIQTYLMRCGLLPALCFLLCGQALFAQSIINADGQQHVVNYTGSYQDLIIPYNTYIQQISFYIKGGSGGVASTANSGFQGQDDGGITPAGQGATVLSAYEVGDGPGQIKPGSIIRFIIGGHGDTGAKAWGSDSEVESVGGGGGASAVLIREPGEPGFTHVLIAGGGGGSCRGIEAEDNYQVSLNENPGMGGTDNDNGTEGTGSDDVGSAGTGGNGGGSCDIPGAITAPISCGGGGVLSDGANNECGQGAGYQAQPSGVPGGDGNCVRTYFFAGGYGYASGGAGVQIDFQLVNVYYAGGGGGGYSGGGGGSAYWGGGGGGGSAIAYDKFYQIPNSNLITAGGTVTVSEHGEGSYQCKLPTVEAHCKNVTLQMQYVSELVLNAYDVVGENTIGGMSYAVSQSIFDCADIGQTIPVTLTVTGIAGNTDQCTAMITVEDHSIPILTCPANVLKDNDPGVCGAVASYGPWTMNDNCGGTVVLETGLPQGSFFPGGTTTQVYRATDKGNNTATCSFTVTVRDVQKPVVTCPANLVKDNNEGFCGAVVSFTATATDNCAAIVEQTSGLLSNAMFPVGTSTVAFRAIDAANNSATCSFTVTVTDKEKPVVFCKDATVELNTSGEGGIVTADVFQYGADNCGAVSQLAVSPNAFSCSNLGANTVTLTVKDSHDNLATCSATVTVLDKRHPVMLCKNVTLNLDASGQATLSTEQVNNGSSDNCAIAVMNLTKTNFTCADLGNQTVQLGATDASGNKAECSSIVTVRDVTAPVAKCKNATIQLNAQGTAAPAFNQLDNGSSDACGIMANTLTPNVLNCANVGTNVIILSVSDASGNSSSCTATVTVKDQVAPQAKCKNITVYLNDAGQAGLTAAQLDNGSTDACGIQSLTINTSSFNCGQINSSVPVWLTVKDVHNNTATCQAMVTVKDNLAPTAICENVTVQLNAQGKATVYGAALADGSYDNCSVWSYAPVSKQYTAANLGVNNLTITVKDWSNNASTCVAQVTVLASGGSLVMIENSTTENGGEQAGEAQAEERMAAASRDENVRIFPNPTAGLATLTFQLAQNEPVSLQIFDVNGRLVIGQALDGLAGDNRVDLELGRQPQGVYWVNIRTAHWQSQKRLVVAQD